MQHIVKTLLVALLVPVAFPILAAQKMRLATLEKMLPTTVNSLLIAQVRSGDTTNIDNLLKAGAQVNAKVNGWTALGEAARLGNTEKVRILLNARADIDAKNGPHDETALMLAKAKNHKDIVRILEAKENLNYWYAYQEKQADLMRDEEIDQIQWEAEQELAQSSWKNSDDTHYRSTAKIKKRGKKGNARLGAAAQRARVLARAQEEQASNEWLQKNTQACPQCSIVIEKIEGCRDVKCRCDYRFCWRCLGPWKMHLNYYPYVLCADEQLYYIGKLAVKKQAATART